VSKWISEQVQRAVLWRIALAKFALISLMTGGSCWLTATNQISEGNIPGIERPMDTAPDVEETKP